MLVNAYVTCREVPAISFPHELLNRRDSSDPALADHLRGFMGFIMDRGKRPMTAIRYGVLQHLERVRHQLALEVDDSHMRAFGAWAEVANAIVFLPDGSVRSPDGAVLVAPTTGDPQPGAKIPFPADALARKTATESALDARGIRVPKSLPPVVAEVEVELRAAAEVARRAIALFACAVRAESIASGNPIAPADIAKKLPRAIEAMTPKERAFIEASPPAKQDVVNHVWRYEAVIPLAWAVGLLGMTFPSALCDVPLLAKTMLDLDTDAFISSARLRDGREILNALDVTFRLHWATTDARVKNAPPPDGVEPGVVAERHHALNWLTCFERADWDDVTTPT